MGDMLGRKQRIKNDEWIEAIGKIEQTVSWKELDQLVNKTVKDIKKKTKRKKAAYAWSGGKDSLVLGEICQQAGINSCVLVVCNLEYKAFTEWVEAHKPPELSVINTGQDMKWLAGHLQMLFSQDSKYVALWFQIVQHRGQAKYYKENQLDMLLLGRRRADGDYVGTAYIHYHKLVMPPIYDWKNGYLCSTHPWPARQWTGGIENAKAEIYEIDSSIVTEAAEHTQSAEEFLENLK